MKYIAFFVGALLIPFLSLAYEGIGYITLSPDSLDYEVGKEVLVGVRIVVPEAITSFRIHLRYDPTLFEVREIKPNTETFPFWWKKEAANGIIALEASTPKPGFQGEDLVAGVVVMAKEAGTKLFEVDEDASLLLNAQDENILKLQEESSPQSDYTIADSEPTGFSVILGIFIILILGVILGIVLFLRKRKK